MGELFLVLMHHLTATLAWLDVPVLANEELLGNLVVCDVGYRRCREIILYQTRRETRCLKSSFFWRGTEGVRSIHYVEIPSLCPG